MSGDQSRSRTLPGDEGGDRGGKTWAVIQLTVGEGKGRNEVSPRLFRRRTGLRRPPRRKPSAEGSRVCSLGQGFQVIIHDGR